MVRLKVSGYFSLDKDQDYFNSNMVRLKAFMDLIIFAAAFKFQFQYGAIKGLCSSPFFLVFPLFQFQYGAIKGRIANQIAGAVVGFQFQYGAIKGTIKLTL